MSANSIIHAPPNLVPKVEAYTFNMIRKGEDTKEWIRHYKDLEEIRIAPKEDIDHGGVYNYNPRFKQWKVSDISETINQIKEDDCNSVNENVFLKLRECVSKITVTLWEPEFLPFNYVILSVNFNSLLIESGDSYDKLNAFFRPIVQCWGSSWGLIPYSDKRELPMYYQLYYNTQTMKSTLSKADEDLAIGVRACYAKEVRYEKGLNATLYLKRCNELKQNFLFNKFNFKRSTISLIRMRDSFFVLGNTGYKNSNWYNAVSIEPENYKYNAGFSYYVPDFQLEEFPLFFISYVLSATFAISSDIYKKDLKEIYKKINDLRTSYRHSVTPDDLDTLSSSLHKLNDMTLDYNMLQSANTEFHGWFFWNTGLTEKRIVTSFDDHNIDDRSIRNLDPDYEIRRPYICRLNKRFTVSIEDIEKKMQKAKDDLKIIKEKIDFEQQRQSQKNDLKLKERMLILSVGTAFFALVVVLDILIK